MNCTEIKTKIDNADEDEKLEREAHQHLNDCAACRSYLAQHERLRGLLANLETESAPQNFNARLATRLAAEDTRAAKFPSRFFNYAPGFGAVALAGCFVFVIASALLFKQSAQDGERLASSTAITSDANQKTFERDAKLIADVSREPQITTFTSVNDNRKLANRPTIAAKRTLATSERKGKVRNNIRSRPSRSLNSSSERTAIDTAILSSGAGKSLSVTSEAASANSLVDANDTSDSTTRLTSSVEKLDASFETTLAAHGIKIKSISSNDVNSPPPNRAARAIVISIQPDSAAARGGLRAGDVIEGINTHTTSISSPIRAINLQIQRGTQTLNITIPIVNPKQ